MFPKLALIPGLLDSQAQSLDFRCRDAECATCMNGVMRTPGALVLTGASTFAYAIDLKQFAAGMPEPVVNCLRNDSRIDAYRSFFNFAHVNQADQVLLHGYNSWAINSPGTWKGDRTATFFAIAPRATEPIRAPRWSGASALV